MPSPLAPFLSLVGDLLLAFHVSGENALSRQGNSIWTRTANESSWALLFQPTHPRWRGFPAAHSHSGAWSVWAMGELNEGDPLEAAIRDGDNLSACVPSLNGRFLILAWDVAAHEWHVWTDRFGTLHAYYATDGKQAALGTFSPAVTAFSSRRLDWHALAGFFGFGFFPGDRTHFEGVKILRPASHYVFDENGQQICCERYWQWHYTPDTSRAYDETVTEYAEIFHAVMEDHLRGRRVALPLSGGLDSRCTAAPITAAQTGRIWAYSYGYSDDSVETHIARQLAAARNLLFQAFTIQPYLFDQLPNILAWTEGFQDITLPRQAYVRDALATQADVLIGALWGDVWHDDMGLAGQKEVDDETFVTHLLHKMGKTGRAWLFEHLVVPRLEIPPEHALDNLALAELPPLAHLADPDFRVKAFKTEHWSFRWSLPPIRVFQSAAWPRLVFYDHRLADFFCTVPTEFVGGRRLQIDYLKRCAPDLARVVWQVYDANLFQYQHFHTWQLPKRALKKLTRTLRRQPVLERNWEVQFAGDAGQKGLEHWLLRKGLRLHAYVSPQAVRALLDDFYRAPLQQGRGYTVSMLLTFSAWLEHYG
jgi:asparagine synthase (glutamine-hydrolysing)